MDHRVGHGSHADKRQSPLFPPVLWSAACDVRMAEHGRRRVKIPIEGSPVVEARSQRICNLCCTPQTPSRGHTPQSHAVCWSKCMPGGRRHDQGGGEGYRRTGSKSPPYRRSRPISGERPTGIYKKSDSSYERAAYDATEELKSTENVISIGG